MHAGPLDLQGLKLPVTGYVAAGEETARLAVVDMDWSRVKAVDLFAVLASFTPSNGSIQSLTVYPSQFGKERMQQVGLR